MKRVVALALILVLGVSTLAYAGFEPTPFRVKLRLQANYIALLAAFSVIDPVLAIPPDDIRPPVLVRLFNGTAFFLARREVRITNIVTPYLGSPPDPYLPPDLVPFMSNIHDASNAILDRVRAGFQIPPDDIRPEVLEALVGLEMQAASLSETVQFFLPLESDYLVRTTYDGVTVLQEVELSLFDFPGNCAAINNGPSGPLLPGVSPAVSDLIVPEAGGLIPDYEVNVLPEQEIGLAVARAWGVDSGGEFATFGCQDGIAPKPTTIDIFMVDIVPPGS